MSTNTKTCVIIGASHAGVNLAFNLRKEGWEGSIHLYDSDPELPYHRPPLSKAYLTSRDSIEKNQLRSADSYTKENIALQLGVTVQAINREEKNVVLGDGSIQSYDKLVIASGARPIIPPIPGIESAKNLFPIRTAANISSIRIALSKSNSKKVVIIGGGYIGLETAASLKKLGASVTVLEREERILARVTAPEMSSFFKQLHHDNGVEVLTSKNVTSIEHKDNKNYINCADGSNFTADIVIVGVGIFVNKELAEESGILCKNGICVDETTKTNDNDIFAIGDCSYHHNPHYNTNLRLESVQNAIDQAKVAAAAICDKETKYNTIPWFWSDQYHVKLQMVGLSQGYNEIILRKESGEGTYGDSFSVWYFKEDTLLAVDAVNNAKAYVIGTKFIKGNTKVNKEKLADSETVFKPVNLLLED
ncbi:3-phenylpropionate/trans-cinnamate dioxygenase ferredoxin reductase subunit [Maribacter vaceletii]|uniref:3-phenylpropionate/trans-cinnamate dioxygenase ferredoxin reductase subunit n=1 Tax=Maribacter vaceletii TaxID=1206816 RepID=A0A495E5D6_9FLAO|nr:FAD-dependent oxidoreductase [Maribacter vaceletii]RKR12155.1 3-phenylpropionate/trans-cinnamate dioxygenase ferredoxin reductase subunit [Maribacter vaceletii]